MAWMWSHKKQWHDDWKIVGNLPKYIDLWKEGCWSNSSIYPKISTCDWWTDPGDRSRPLDHCATCIVG